MTNVTNALVNNAILPMILNDAECHFNSSEDL